MLKPIVAALVLAATCLPGVAQAQGRQYVAYIGQEDLFNSRGERLTAPWQVIRQDRANYHRFGIRHPGDQWDPLFDDANDRALMEQYIRDGYISPQAARDVMAGGATIVVRIFANVQQGQWVEIDVYR